MRRLLGRRPSPAMFVALLALFVALGGSSYAAVKIRAGDIARGAVGTRAIANNAIRSADIRNGVIIGADVKDDALTNADIDNSTLRAKSADTATSADKATTATTATSATTATNADSLDSLDSTAFARRACDSPTGAIKGVVTVAASPTFPGTFTTVAGYNCSGQTIEASRIGPGRYEVHFNGSPATQALATPTETGVFADSIGVRLLSAGRFEVVVVDPATDTVVDHGFTMLIP
jgi:hypothetical protein